MIRPLEEKDIEMVCSIVNENWKNIYAGYVNPLLLNETGCAERIRHLKSDFTTHRLSEYVWKEDNQVSAMLSIGDTADTDIEEAFEVWRIYVAAQFQKKGIDKTLLDFAEQQAKEQGYKKVKHNYQLSKHSKNNENIKIYLRYNIPLEIPQGHTKMPRNVGNRAERRKSNARSDSTHCFAGYPLYGK
ncbi:MAG: GNAT family N-acetyltransferase [Lachnospiraceae bacterium]|nr:GNAT family N-acetyltransferase [Lachnospiraceae bacterium]MDE6253644.1 GNAT family N-acetyltransferase [Lachnospiraceae bacterium]